MRRIARLERHPAVNESWRCSAAYLYVMTLPGELLAWEYLRRNPEYLLDWHRGQSRPFSSKEQARRWGLEELEDPSLDARDADPHWHCHPRSIVQFVPADAIAIERSPRAAPIFSLWKFQGRKTLDYQADSLLLTARSSSKRRQVMLHGSLHDGSAYRVSLAPNTEAHAALAAIFGAGSPEDGAQAQGEHPCGVPAPTHAHALQALDALADGASHRQIAEVIHDVDTVIDSWEPDSALRAQVRYALKKARLLMVRGYKGLIPR
jgi:hypothetical protein